jgi:hypothetical protein
LLSCWRSKDSPHHSQPLGIFEIYSCDEGHSADGSKKVAVNSGTDLCAPWVNVGFSGALSYDPHSRTCLSADEYIAALRLKFRQAKYKKVTIC